MNHLTNRTLTPILLAVLVVISVFALSVNSIPSVNALPVQYNQTALNFGLTSVARNSSSYDVFPLIPDNWLWMKFDNNTLDSSPLAIPNTITYSSQLYGVWHFEGNTADSSAAHYTGTVTGTTTFVGGHEGQGFSFNGASYITTSWSPNFERTQAFTVSTWMKTSASATLYGIAGVGNAGQGWFFDSLQGNLDFDLRHTANVDELRVTSVSTYNDGNWHHVVVTYDGSSNANGVKMYVDGASISTNIVLNVLSSTISNGTPVCLGCLGSGGTLPFSGVLDEMRFYNFALPQSQVSALYMVGHYAQSHTFDGGEYVTTNSLAAPVGTNDRTFTFWIKAPTPSATEGIMSYGTGGLTNQAVIIQLLTTNQILFAGWANDQASTGSVTPNVWNYVAIEVSNGGATRTFYINGVLDRSVTTTALNTFSNTAINIGFDSVNLFGGSSKLIGQLDNLKIYPYALSSSQITSDYNSISPISSGKQFMSYYNGVSGSSTLTKKLGFGSATTTLLCTPNTTPPEVPTMVSNMSSIFYQCGTLVDKFDVATNTNSHIYTSQDANAVSSRQLFMGIKHIFSGSGDGSGFALQLNSEKGNVSQGGFSGGWVATNQQINIFGLASTVIKFNDNSTLIRTISDVTHQCNINFNPSNLTKPIDNIVCDQAIPAMAIKYWNGMNIQKIGGYNTNTTQQFLNSVDNSAYKKLLTLPCALYGAESPCITFILTDPTQTDYIVVLTSAHVYYGKAQTALNYLLHNNYALQTYDVITVATDSTYPIPNPILQPMTLYGFNLNNTIQKTGMMTLASGYSLRTTTVSPSIRLIDPRWSSDNTDIPIISSTSSLFPIFLTVSNAPQFSAIKVTQGNQIINGQESVWSIAQLDSTRSVEFDLPSGTCANTYIADISVSPSVWNFEGIICASGLNQKTISYTNTLPISFWTSKYSATHSYTPSSGILTVTTRATTGPYTENIIIKNSNGTTIQNYTNTVNGTIDTPSFNVTSVGKPLTLTVNINGQPIYYAFLGSAVSFASVSSFFATYFSYHGFNLLSLIPIIFAGMFTRNSVGIGAVAVVLLIASLNFFSLVVVPEAVITVMMFVSLIGLVAYRVLLY